MVKNVLNSRDSEDAESLVYDACENLRKLVFIPQIEKIADMNKQEEADAVGTDNADEIPDDMSNIQVDPGENGEVATLESYMPEVFNRYFK